MEAKDNMEDPLIYGVKEISEILKMNRNKVLHLLQEGTIRSLSLGRPRQPGDAWHVTKAQLDDYITKNS